MNKRHLNLVFEGARQVLKRLCGTRPAILAWDIRCGLHSGFRPCCVAWFVTLWPLTYGSRVYRWYFQAAEHRRFGFIPCPLCLALDRHVEVLDCRCMQFYDWLYQEELTPCAE